MYDYLYSKQHVTDVNEKTIGFLTRDGLGEVRFSFSESMEKRINEFKVFSGRDVLVGISTSGRVFDIEPAY